MKSLEIHGGQSHHQIHIGRDNRRHHRPILPSVSWYSIKTVTHGTCCNHQIWLLIYASIILHPIFDIPMKSCGNFPLVVGWLLASSLSQTDPFLMATTVSFGKKIEGSVGYTMCDHLPIQSVVVCGGTRDQNQPTGGKRTSCEKSDEKNALGHIIWLNCDHYLS